MNTATKKQLRADLKALLAKYDVSICFTCSDSSDTHGLRGDTLIIKDARGSTVFDAQGWALTQHNLKK
jgi:hypothetical protein